MPMFFQPRRPSPRLRSFHLSPSKPYFRSAPEVDSESVTTTRRGVSIDQMQSFRGTTVVKLAIAVSLVFIFTICFSFIGANVDEEYFQKALTQTANTEPGIVFLGENVDVDVDEPSITIRWSILACGEGLFLPGSAGAHGSAMCGLPTQPLRIFVDNDSEPAVMYDPTQIPFNRDTGSRRSIQNLVQFDSDHVLDVHQAHLYPFDSYILSSTIRATSENNKTVPIRRLLTLETTSSFNIDTVDTETYSTSASDTGTISYSRDIDMHVARPASARLIAMTLFALNWIMAHVGGGLAYMCGKLTTDTRPTVHFLCACAILIVIPQLRNSMPDAPGFDGVLIDTIGYFPQMIIAAGSAILILLMFVSQAIDQSRESSSLPPKSYPLPPPAALNRVRRPATPTQNSTTAQVAQYEKDRIVRHMNGEYVFPPIRVGVGVHVPDFDPFGDASHRRSRPTMSPVSMDSRLSGSAAVKTS